MSRSQAVNRRPFTEVVREVTSTGARGVLSAEVLDPGRHVGPARCVEEFVEAVEDHHGTAGQQQQVHQAGRSRALVEVSRVYSMWPTTERSGGSLAA